MLVFDFTIASYNLYCVYFPLLTCFSLCFICLRVVFPCYFPEYFRYWGMCIRVRVWWLFLSGDSSSKNCPHSISAGIYLRIEPSPPFFFSKEKDREQMVMGWHRWVGAVLTPPPTPAHLLPAKIGEMNNKRALSLWHKITPRIDKPPQITPPLEYCPGGGAYTHQAKILL